MIYHDIKILLHLNVGPDFNQPPISV